MKDNMHIRFKNIGVTTDDWLDDLLKLCYYILNDIFSIARYYKERFWEINIFYTNNINYTVNWKKENNIKDIIKELLNCITWEEAEYYLKKPEEFKNSRLKYKEYPKMSNLVYDILLIIAIRKFNLKPNFLKSILIKLKYNKDHILNKLLLDNNYTVPYTMADHTDKSMLGVVLYFMIIKYRYMPHGFDRDNLSKDTRLDLLI